MEQRNAPGTAGFRQLLENVGTSIEKKYPTVKCVGCEKSFHDPVWRCQPCALKKTKVLGEYRVSIDPVRMMLAQDARKKVRFDAEKVITVKLRGHGLGALRTLHELIADVCTWR